MAEPIFYVAIGDSLTVGYGVSPEKSFVSRYRAQMEQTLDRPVNVENFGVVGATTDDVMRMLHSDRDLQSAIRDADIITITAGGNDLLRAAKQFLLNASPQALKTALRAFRTNYDTIWRVILEAKAGASKPYAARVLNLYNPFPVFEDAVYWVGKFNRQIWQCVGDNTAVNVYERFMERTEQLLAEDMVHPNEHGYEIMAAITHERGYEPVG